MYISHIASGYDSTDETEERKAALTSTCSNRTVVSYSFNDKWNVHPDLKAKKLLLFLELLRILSAAKKVVVLLSSMTQRDEQGWNRKKRKVNKLEVARRTPASSMDQNLILLPDLVNLLAIVHCTKLPIF